MQRELSRGMEEMKPDITQGFCGTKKAPPRSRDFKRCDVGETMQLLRRTAKSQKRLLRVYLRQTATPVVTSKLAWSG